MLATVDASVFSLAVGVEGWVYEACFLKTGRDEGLVLLTREVGILERSSGIRDEDILLVAAVL